MMINDLNLSSLPRAFTPVTKQLLQHSVQRWLPLLWKQLWARLAMILCSLCLMSLPAQAELNPVALERDCIEEAQPQGLSVALDAQRRAHLFFFSNFNELIHLTISELTGEINTEREVLTSFNTSDSVLKHSRSTRLQQGIATCYMDPVQQGIVVYEKQGEHSQTSLALSTISPSYCDIISENDVLWLSAVSSGELIVARGDAQYNLDQELIGRVWTQEVAVPFSASGYSAIVRSGDKLWAASQAGGTSLFLASRPINQVQAWTVEQVSATDGQAFGERLQLSARSAGFNGQVWATHGRLTTNPILNSDKGFIITEIYEGAWDNYDPIANFSAGTYHDAFGGPVRGSEEGYLYVLTRSHLRSSIFGNSDALMLLRYQSLTSNPNTQYLEGPLSGTGKIFTELAMGQDPLAELMAFSHHYDNILGQLCRWSAPDQDHDGLPNAYENQIGTQVDQSDSDQDGKSDGEEVLLTGTDPLSPNLPPPSCDDQTQNGLESDIDCGGPSCPACPAESACVTHQDCSDLQCLNQICVTPSCSDGVQNRDESDIDCGGQACAPCDTGFSCQSNSDCQTELCLNQECVSPSCEDGLRNQDESDTDCGGESCEPCSDGQRCELDQDCLYNQCLLSVCVAPSCDDGVQGIGESDVDCGGLICARCQEGQSCTSHADCASRRCASTLIGKVCIAPSCEDLTQNGDETDTDCGGSCAACPPNYACLQNDDCQSLLCDQRLCTTANCEDSVQNRDESDVDCGGLFCLACPTTALCNQDSDCQSQHCLGGRCAEATCSDQRMNQDEEDIDCGGACQPCFNVVPDMMLVEVDMMPIEVDMMLVEADMMSIEADMMPIEADMMPVEADMMPVEADMMPVEADSHVIVYDQYMDEPDTDMSNTEDMFLLHIDDMASNPSDAVTATNESNDQAGSPMNMPPSLQDEVYDPSVFAPQRPDSGCDMQKAWLNDTSHSSSTLPPLYLILGFCLAVYTRKRQSSSSTQCT